MTLQQLRSGTWKARKIFEDLTYLWEVARPNGDDLDVVARSGRDCIWVPVEEVPTRVGEVVDGKYRDDEDSDQRLEGEENPTQRAAAPSIPRPRRPDGGVEVSIFRLKKRNRENF